MTAPPKLRVGLALGGGSARGWAHIGVIRLIAVDLGSGILGRRLRSSPSSEAPGSAIGDWRRRVQDNLGAHVQPQPGDGPTMPSIHDVLTSSIDIMQVRISRSRMAGDPPDLIVAPRLAHLHLLDFQRAEEAIEEGRRAVQRVAHVLAELNHDAT